MSKNSSILIPYSILSIQVKALMRLAVIFNILLVSSQRSSNYLIFIVVMSYTKIISLGSNWKDIILIYIYYLA